MSTRHIMRHSHNLFSCRIQIRQLLRAAAINARETFANTILEHPGCCQNWCRKHLVIGWSLLFLLTASSISRTDTYLGNGKWPYWSTITPRVATKVKVWTAIFSIFTTPNVYCIVLSGYYEWICVGTKCLGGPTRRGSCKIVSATSSIWNISYFNERSDNRVIALDYCKHMGNIMDLPPLFARFDSM